MRCLFEGEVYSRAAFINLCIIMSIVSGCFFVASLLSTGNNLLLESHVVATFVSTRVLAHLHRLLCLAWLIIPYESVVS